jgi:mannose-6-phosphate isomerase-like protein (cupin superfamily)
MNTNTHVRGERDQPLLTEEPDHGRRHLLLLLSAATGTSALQVPTASAREDSTEIQSPRRALTGRDASGKSIFQSFDVTPQIVTFESRPGLAFYEIYATDDVPHLTGREPDPMTTKKGSFPKPHGSLFRLTLFPPRPAEGSTPAPGGYEKYLEELSQKIPGMAEHFERDTPGMHTSDTLDYGVVIRGEMMLELDDGRTVHLRQGDCVVQNGTRHRWRNPLSEPCLMAFVLIGGVRGA